MKRRRLLVIKYTNETYVDRLKTCLDMCCMPYVVIKECEFIDGDALWRIYIDRGKCTWGQVKQEVNRVHAAKFNYANNMYIKNGRVYVDV